MNFYHAAPFAFRCVKKRTFIKLTIVSSSFPLGLSSIKKRAPKKEPFFNWRAFTLILLAQSAAGLLSLRSSCICALRLRRPSYYRPTFACCQTHHCEFEPISGFHQLKKELLKRSLFLIGAPGGIRTHNLLIRSQMLYPIELRAHRITALIAQFIFFCKPYFAFFLLFCKKSANFIDFDKNMVYFVIIK